MKKILALCGLLGSTCASAMLAQTSLAQGIRLARKLSAIQSRTYTDSSESAALRNEQKELQQDMECAAFLSHVARRRSRIVGFFGATVSGTSMLCTLADSCQLGHNLAISSTIFCSAALIDLYRARYWDRQWDVYDEQLIRVKKRLN